jgi:hypothetical protein
MRTTWTHPMDTFRRRWTGPRPASPVAGERPR